MTMSPPTVSRPRLALIILLLAGGATAQDQTKPDFWRLFESAVEVRGHGEPAGVVLEHMAGIPAKFEAVPHRLSRIDAALTRPWTPPALAEDLRETLAADGILSKGRLRVDAAVPGIAGDLGATATPSEELPDQELTSESA